MRRYDIGDIHVAAHFAHLSFITVNVDNVRRDFFQQGDNPIVLRRNRQIVDVNISSVELDCFLACFIRKERQYGNFNLLACA